MHISEVNLKACFIILNYLIQLNFFLIIFILYYRIPAYGVKAINFVLNRIIQMEEDFKYFNNDDLKQKVEEIKMTSNGDMKSAINSLYIFSLSLERKEKLKKFNYENISKKTKGSKLSRKNTKNLTDAMYSYFTFFLNLLDQKILE